MPSLETILTETTSTEATSEATLQPVTPLNFPRAESDLYFGNFVNAKESAFGKFQHNREVTPIDPDPSVKQDVVRMNRDTLYSNAVFDLQSGPIMITLPEPDVTNGNSRFLSMQIVDEDQYTPTVIYGKGTVTLIKGKGNKVDKPNEEDTVVEIGTRYVAVFVRIFVDPNEDLAKVHDLQQKIKVYPENQGTFEPQTWDTKSQDTIREALSTLGTFMPNYDKAFGTKEEVDPVAYLIGAATGWGGNPVKDAKYDPLVIPNNDGDHAYTLTVKDVPVDGFWSVSVYDAEGYFVYNDYRAYSINNVTGKKDADGSITIQFGGKREKIPNYIPIPEQWNATIRLYRPRPEILSGDWTFPELERL
jgi:hypothetical protein